MRSTRNTLRAVFASALLSLSALSPGLTFAQQTPQTSPQLPMDPAIRYGVLDNGLTYFIRKNQKPEGRASFYISQRVGSMQEQESQRGLAHFLEHMAFNGTKHFPGKNLISYLETIGVRFGSNLNAYTSFDETVYNISDVPVARTSTVDSCILILHDWSNALLLEDKEIDAERGVIQEEWRQRDNGNLRMAIKAIQQAMPGSLYGQRMPIGLMDVVRNFKYDELRNYYKKWYRPDLQGIIIIGDIDVDQVEASIKRIFADIPKPVNPAPRVYEQIAHLSEPIAAVLTDPEAIGTTISISFKADALPRDLKNTSIALTINFVKAVVSEMLSNRFAEITQKANAPFLQASASFDKYGGIAYNADEFSFSAKVKEGGIERGLAALVAEIERVHQYGFTQGEYTRASKVVVTNYKNLYNERDKRSNEAFAHEYSSYFTNGGYIPGIEVEYQLIQQIADNLPLAQINEPIKEVLSTKEIFLSVTGPQKPGLKYLTSDELLKLFEADRKKPVEAYKDAVSDQKLMDKLPPKGKIIKEEKNGIYGTTIWTLSNGTKVIYKTTDFKADEINLSGYRNGGRDALDKQDRLASKAFNGVINLGGLAGFDDVALGKILTGRTASINPYLSDTEDCVSGASTREDLETMLQLLYLNFTAKRSDKEAFAAQQERMINAIESSKTNPMSGLKDSIAAALYPGHPELLSLTTQEVKKLPYERIMQLYKEIYSSARGFEFVFVGNIDASKLRPLVEQYIASLPAGKPTPPKTQSRMPRIRSGKYTTSYTQPMKTPASVILNVFSGNIPYNQRNAILLSILGENLSQLYTATIREEEGGTYGVSASASVSRTPANQAVLQIFFQCDPANAKRLNDRVHKELNEALSNGINTEYFAKTIKNMEKQHGELLKENTYWMQQIINHRQYGDDFVANYDHILSGIKASDVTAIAKELVGQGNCVQLMLLPATANKQ